MAGGVKARGSKPDSLTSVPKTHMIGENLLPQVVLGPNTCATKCTHMYTNQLKHTKSSLVVVTNEDAIGIIGGRRYSFARSQSVF